MHVNRSSGVLGAACAVALSAGVGALALAPGAAAAGPACGSTITADTRLSADLRCAGDGLKLAPGVTLDLGGHRLVGSGTGVGIDLAQQEGATTTVRGGSVIGFSSGVRSVGETASTIQLERVTLNRAPVSAEFATVHLSRSRIVDSDLQVWAGSVTVADSTLVRSSTAREMTTFTLLRSRLVGGVWGQDENQSITIADSVLDGTGTTGRAPSTCSTSCTITDSTIRRYDKPLRSGMNRLSVTDSRFTDMRGGAIANESAATIQRTTFTRNGGTAVQNEPWGGTVLKISDSTFSRNANAIGIPGEYPIEASIQRTMLRDNSGDGLVSQVPGVVHIGSVTALRNGGRGIHAPGAVDDGGNVARGNGVSDCTGVVCARR